jgi:hypothetical protein
LLTAVVLYFAPNASYLFVWPLASVLLGITLRRSLPGINGGTTQFVSLLVFSFVPLLLLAPIFIMFYVALGLALPQILMIFCVLSLLLIWPLIRSIGFVADGKAGLLIFIVGLVMTAVVLLGRGFDTRHPRGEELFYAIDVGQQQGFWVSSDARPGSWLGEFLGDQATVSNMTRIMPGYDQEILTRESDLPAYQAAKMTVNRDHLVNGMREISFHLQPAVAGEYINLLFATDSGMSGATVNGFPVKMPDGDTDLESPSWWRWRLYGVPEEGADISVTVAAGKPVPIKIVGVDYELPDGAPARPENSMRRKYTWSDSVVIFQTVILE